MEPTDNSAVAPDLIAMKLQNRADYNLNRNAVPADDVIGEARKHGGQLVARSPDGIETYLYANSYDEIYDLLALRHIPAGKAVVTRVPEADEPS